MSSTRIRSARASFLALVAVSAVLTGCSMRGLSTAPVATAPHLRELSTIRNTSNTWSQAAPMPTARLLPGVAVVGTKIYVVGGINSNGALYTNEIFDAV